MLFIPPRPPLTLISRRTTNFLGIGLEYAPFVVLYAIAFEWCIRTAGVPYANAIAHEAAKRAAKFTKNVGYAMAEVSIEDDEDVGCVFSTTLS